MKTKNEILAMLEIAIVLCSVFLVATLSGVAADQTAPKVGAREITAASEDDFILEIYGNANEDECIDMRDYTYAARIICWLEDETTFADANYDGRISVADMTQTGLIILGREGELTLVDSADRIVTVKKPVERIVIATTSNGEAIQILRATDKVVGVADHGTLQSPICFPELSQLPSFGPWFHGVVDYEAILALNPDVVLIYSWEGYATMFSEDLPDTITVIGFDFIMDETMREEFEKLGYILGKRAEAKEFIDFYESYVDTMKKRTKGLSEDEKPRVYFNFGSYMFYLTISGDEPCYQPLFDMAGGINIAADLTEDTWGGWWGTGGLYPEVDAEWLLAQNPDIIINGGWVGTEGGYTSDDPSDMKGLIDYTMSLPELVVVEAVKTGEVYAIHFDTITGPGVFIGGTYYAKWFQPDLFEDFDPQAIHQEYVDFRGIDFDVYEQGVFVYPPLE